MRRSGAVRSAPRKKRTRLIPASAFFLSEAELREQKFFAPLFFKKAGGIRGGAPAARARHSLYPFNSTTVTPSSPSSPRRLPRGDEGEDGVKAVELKG